MKTKLNQILNAKPTFRNTFKALNDGKVVCVPNSNTYYKLTEKGMVVSYGDDPLNWVSYNNIDSVLQSASGTIYEEVEINWYDNIPKRGILCEVWDGEKEYNDVAIIHEYDESHKAFISKSSHYKHARPLLLDEMKELLYED